MMVGEMESATLAATTADFAAAARRLSIEARRHRLRVPSYRSPPRLVGVDRTIRRRHDGGAVVAVRVRGRPLVAVLGDMIEGVVVANRLTPPASDRARTELWRVLDDLHDDLRSHPHSQPSHPYSEQRQPSQLHGRPHEEGARAPGAA